jgi:hypothetical protein
LPAELQIKVAKTCLAAVHDEETMALVPHSESPDSQISLFVLPPKVSKEERLSLSEEQEKQADYRYQTIAPLIRFSQCPKERRPTIRLQDGREINNLDALAEYVADQHSTSPQTVWRWYGRFRRLGYAALADNARSDKGSSRFFSSHPEAERLVKSKYLAERLSIAQAYDALRREFPNDCPCYDTVRDFLRSLHPLLSVMAREGSREFKERFEGYGLRKPPERVNQVWISDHVQHDVWIRNIHLETGQPFFPGVPLNAALRPWMTAWMDWRSRKIVGAVWFATPSSNTISSALRLGIEQCGIPEEAYVDNGKDYRKVRVGAAHDPHEREAVRALSPECMGVLARLGIHTTNALPYHPQSKPIESWFGNRLHKRFDQLWGDLYCGTYPATRPEGCDEALKQHRLFMDGKRKSSPLPAANDFVQLARHFIQEYNTKLPHSGQGMNDRTPEEVSAELGTSVHRLDDTNKNVLDQLFWERDRRRVGEGGCVKIYNQRYEPDGPESKANLYLQIERDVLIACDPANLGEAIAMNIDGCVIGRLKAEKLLEWGAVSREEYVASLRERRRVTRTVKEYIAGLSRGVETELEALRRRSGVIQAPAAEAKRLPVTMTSSALNAVRPEFPEAMAERFFERRRSAAGGND